MPRRPARSSRVPAEPTGIEALDGLATRETCSIDDYVAAASGYVLGQSALSPGRKKSGQIRLSHALGLAFATDLRSVLSRTVDLNVGERRVAGALRPVNADVSEIHPIDGLRLAVELKPVNLAVGRAIWNRFGDIRTFAVNIHLKFPFCVIGGVLAIPTVEEVGTKQSVDAAREEAEASVSQADALPSAAVSAQAQWKSTRHLIDRAITRLVRAGGRRTEADAPHLLEAIAVIVYDPQTGRMAEDLPSQGSGLRWDEFISAMAAAYDSRFED